MKCRFTFVTTDTIVLLENVYFYKCIAVGRGDQNGD